MRSSMNFATTEQLSYDQETKLRFITEFLGIQGSICGSRPPRKGSTIQENLERLEAGKGARKWRSQKRYLSLSTTLLQKNTRDGSKLLDFGYLRCNYMLTASKVDRRCSTSQACEQEDTSMENRMFIMLESINTHLDTLLNQSETRFHVIKRKMDAVDARVNLLEHDMRLVKNEEQWASYGAYE
ncbi:hypothetical protein ACH5RR_041405 [Cinchona calisaya]|uniref:Uncharacterized protein n=1 Tax=Cinchona calisaya TaxID=153742 RepID=A0ABD2XU86_9GENT